MSRPWNPSGRARWALAALALLTSPAASVRAEDPNPERRALDYLAVEVPRWSAENGCYSCHNNGDGARALYEASRRGLHVPPEALADTTRWLAGPGGWDDNGGDGPFSDKRLARVQFASALALAVASGAVGDRAPLVEAAGRVAGDQAGDGSWAPDGPDAIGSPATYGRPLATLAARQVLHAADPAGHRERIRAADAWLSRHPIASVLDASVELLRPDVGGAPADPDRKAEALDLLRRGQSSDGGWGPYATAPPEPFDTALALLALSQHRDRPGVTRLIARGRGFLIAAQLPSGGWVETTRPSGGESYAQHVSTTGWATMALLETMPDG